MVKFESGSIALLGHAVAAAGLLLAAAVTSAAARQDFTLDNETGHMIGKVYVSTARTDEWEEDVLGRDVLEDGDAVKISFPRRENACRFDLKVVYDDGDDAAWTNLHLCEISTVEIHYNKRTGRDDGDDGVGGAKAGYSN